jgi:hypothetical protein
VQPEDIGGDKPGLRNPAPCRVTDTIGIPEWNTVSIKTDYNEMLTNWCRISQPSTVCIWGHDHISAKLKSSASYGDDSPIHLPWFQASVTIIYPDLLAIISTKSLSLIIINHYYPALWISINLWHLDHESWYTIIFINYK